MLIVLELTLTRRPTHAGHALHGKVQEMAAIIQDLMNQWNPLLIYFLF